ncbi:MAG: tetratricopeptide repeat protein [Ferrovibrio sp.]|uniref:tetratricopeptide repeat protein n=1 Tax=Ferrovibrio sp. TaxID=1917215 RepID=UPI00391A5C74
MPQADPLHPEAQRALQDGVVAHQAGDLAGAERRYRAVLAHHPEQADALHLLGVIADQQGRHKDAAALIRRAIAAVPDQPAFHGNLGTALYALGDMAGAEAAYRRALALDPAHADSHANLGILLAARGDRAALDCFRAALAAAPMHPAAHRGLIAALLARQDHAAAAQAAGIALQQQPLAADLRDLAALALQGLGEYHKALAQHRKALALAPDDLSYREHYAATLARIQNEDAYRDAIAEYRAILARQPDRLNALLGLGVALLRSQQPLAALQPLQQAMQQNDTRPDILVNYGLALAYAGRREEAIACADRAVALAPGDGAILCQRGMLRMNIGDLDGAAVDFRAVAAASQNRTPETLADARLYLGTVLLSRGRLAEGWPLYAARMAGPQADARGLAISRLLPEWDGRVRPGQRILVWGEQGVGDQVIYASMLPELAARGAEFLFACDPRLVSLFRRSFPGIRVESAVESELPALARQADMHIGLGSLGAWLRPDLDHFPPAQAFLRPDAGRADALRRKYHGHGHRAVVGLTWRSRSMRSEALKSIPLQAWAPILAQPDVLFVDMQYGDTSDDRKAVRETLGIDILHDDDIDAMSDLDGFAAQCAAMDLVIGVSNSGIHIAAATGLPTWVMLPGSGGLLWYWFHDRGDSPWYPKARLFRQQPGSRGDDWQDVIAHTATAFAAWLAGDGHDA